ncbi:hypothetical protein MDOR_20770 [Mycolicibacterium doricum]|uniref:Uncharacterized protein n=1 Tax=Mycolicibacterium doricum TaxID=126673 RepID=A0A7I7VWL3_9MYCO|nr:hypothetical protein [Mycolicibacterium doricum]BBZ07908.1 hypothetical protein MDOR_20770 [Mycolicibacterium doricum]
MSLPCSHFDAYRFFTLEAAGRNLEPLGRERQVDTGQPGCLHAAMDLYKWAHKRAPLVASDLVMDCLELAVDARCSTCARAHMTYAATGSTPLRSKPRPAARNTSGRNRTSPSGQRRYTPHTHGAV